MTHHRIAHLQEISGLASRRAAADILDRVLHHGRPLDEELESQRSMFLQLSEQDRALSRRLVATALRRLGTLRYLLDAFLDRSLPLAAARAQTALLLGATQILWLDVPDHAAVDLSVRLAKVDRRAAHYSGLVNAVLRRIIREGKALLSRMDTVALDTPAWLMARWIRTYGNDTARAIAMANGREPSLDLTVKDDPHLWADRLGGRVLRTGTVRIIPHGPVTAMTSFAEGHWWVQDAAAALPARLFGEVRGKRIADLCAAPGGKAAQLAHAGAEVTAVDRSPSRLIRLRDNFARLALTVEAVAADASEWQAEPFDGILLDAPCSSTGTIRRHPDVPWLKNENDLLKLTALQRRLLDHAVTLVKPGGTLVYCTCSLEPEEGEEMINAFLVRHPHIRRRPIEATDIFGLSECLTPEGDLRTLPCHFPDPEPRMSGMDGFYAARLERLEGHPS